MSNLIKLTIEHEGRTYDLWKEGGDGVPRAKDLDVARWLGFDKLHNIRKLIERHRPSLGDLFSAMEKSGGRPGTTYYLTQEQVLYLSAKSETPVALAVLRAMIRVFLLAAQGHVHTEAELLKRLEMQDRRLAAQSAELAHLRLCLSAPRRLIGETEARCLTCRIVWLVDLALGIADKRDRQSTGYRELRGRYFQQAWEATGSAPGTRTAWDLLTFEQSALIEQWIARKEHEVKRGLRGPARREMLRRHAERMAGLQNERQRAAERRARQGRWAW